MTHLPIPSALPAHVADRMAAPIDDDGLCHDIAESHRAELVTGLIERMPDGDLVEGIQAKLETDPMLLTALRNIAAMSTLDLGRSENRARMCRLAATVGDSIRQYVDRMEGDALVADEARRMREEG